MRPRRSTATPGSLLLAALAVASALVGCGGTDGPAGPSADGPTTSAARGSTAAGVPAPGDAAGDAGRAGDAGPAAGDAGRAGDARTAEDPPTERTSTATRTPEAPPPPASWTARCPTPTKSPLGCRAVRARVLTIQSLDPDGDGDLHVVAVGGSVTGPGLTVFDVRTALRPRRDPRPGEWVTGAGPVFRGSYRQKQIQVDVFRVWRPRR